MLVVSTLKKLLCILRYPSFSPDLLGEYNVGIVQQRIPRSTDSHIFYPTTASPKTHDEKMSYFRPNAASALAHFYSMGQDSDFSVLLEYLTLRQHPCLANAPPLTTDKNNDQGFPLVLFSHGLGGCMELYTQLCQQLASLGMIVVAMEHEDGSGSFALTSEGEVIPYKRPDKSPYSREKVINFRRPFLQKRVDETLNAIEFFLSDSDSPSHKVQDTSTVFTQIIQAVDQSKGIALFGHSFGGASMALTTQQESPISKSVNSVTMLDPWMFSLEDDALKMGISGSSSLSILSETWVTNNPESQKILELHSNCLSSSIYYAPCSVHASFSDATNFLPGLLTKRIGLRGKKENRHVTIRSCAKACFEHITNSVKNIDGHAVDRDERSFSVLVPFPLPPEVKSIRKK